MLIPEIHSDSPGNTVRCEFPHLTSKDPEFNFPWTPNNFQLMEQKWQQQTFIGHPLLANFHELFE